MAEAQGRPRAGRLPLRLLLVEGNAAEADVLLDMLGAELPTAEIKVVRSLAGALSALERDHDVVLTNLSLPDADGLEVVGVLREARPDTAVVALTTDPAVPRQAMGAGAGDCLVQGAHDAARLAEAVLTAGHRAMSFDPQTDALDPACLVTTEGAILAVNEPWLAYCKANGGELESCGVGVNYLAVCDRATGDRSGGASEVAFGLRSVLAGRAARFEHEYRCNSADEERWICLQASRPPGLDGVLVRHHDITATKLAARAHGRKALRDKLTDLPNRALLMDRLEQALAEGSRSRNLVSVALLDLDQFGAINESLGHDAGDALLVQVAARLLLRVREGDTLARFAGDQFVVVWRDLKTAEQAHELSEGLSQAFEAPFLLAGTQVRLSASIGVSIDQWTHAADELLLAADTAMFDASQRGMGLVRVFTPGLPGCAVAKMRSEVSLRTAMYRGELVVFYQPVVDLTCGVVVGAEALVRWRHPTDGLLEPDHFIPTAEASGLIVGLGAWVLEQACAQAVRWHASGLRLDMAVNLSTLQVAHPDLVETVTRVLRETRMDPDHLVLEVTESVVMEDAEEAARVFNQLADLGVQVSIDDFGTGYSSLLYLKRYPVHALKVDRTFVSGMGFNDEDDAIVASVIGLARAVGGSCVAEGVETHEQYAALRALGCDYGQGWLFGRAVPAEELPALAAQIENDMAERQLTMPLGAQLREQVDNEREHAAEERDQAGDQRDQRGDRRDRAGDRRDRVGDRRDRLGDERDHAGDQRDEAADKREHEADVREHAADERDHDAQQQRQAGVGPSVAAVALRRAASARSDAASDRTRASHDRQDGASDRDEAEHERDTALTGRSAGASERTQAEHERNTATVDRDASATAREEALFDRLTGLHLRAAGFVELEQEMDRSRRTHQPLVVAFIEIDRLKAINDVGGRPAGDRLLREVAQAMTAALRSGDLIMRYGGDGFVCALSCQELVDAERRLALVEAALASAPEHGRITVGFAQFRPDDSPGDLVARADAARYRRRQQQRHARRDSSMR